MKNFLKKYFPIIVINIVSIILICYPFIKANTLITSDFPGHVFATTFMRDNIFPDISGWNPFQNLGYPIGSYYPPLIQYFVSGISSITNLEVMIVYKLLIVLVILLLPWCILFFFKKLNKEKVSNTIIMSLSVIVFLMFVILPSTFGGDIKATLSSGLINNFLTIPILYLFLGYIYEYWLVKSNKNNIIKLSLLLSLLILSHLVAGLVGAIIAFVVIVAKVIRQKDYKALLIPIFSLLLTGFFVIPYILNTRYLTGSKPVISDLYSSLGILGVIVITSLLIFLKTKKRSYLIFIISAS
ncbi:MAG: 6-pyruvoyl-tetrahydropterin synthase-related protein, partial [bacterium]